MRAPLRGFSLPYFSRSAIRPGISVSAMSSSFAAKIGLIDVGNDAIDAKLQLSRGRGRCHHGFNAP